MRIKTLLTEKEIQKKVKSLADEISKDYKNKKLTVVPVLKGSIVFFADLIRRLKVDCIVDFIAVSSYDSKKSNGIVQLVMDLKQNPVGKHLLIVEDIVDSGRTLKYLCGNLKMRGSLSVSSCVLLDKPSARTAQVKIDYKGFTIPDKFVVGYGLDYKEKYRNLPFIGTIEK